MRSETQGRLRTRGRGSWTDTQPRQGIREHRWRSQLSATGYAAASLVVLATWGCGSSEPVRIAQPLPAAVVSDSAGLRKVRYELGQAELHRAIVWSLGAKPEIQVKAVDAELGWPLAVARAELLPGGRLAIGVQDRQEVFVFGRDGKLEQRLTPQGCVSEYKQGLDGPWKISKHELAVYVDATRCIAVWDTSGRLERATSYGEAMDPKGQGGAAKLLGFAAQGAAVVRMEAPEKIKAGFSRPLFTVLALDERGKVRRSEGVYLGLELRVDSAENGRYALGRPPFAFETLAAAGNGVIALADNAKYEVRLLSVDGQVKTLLTGGVPAEEATAGDLRAVVEQNLDGRRKVNSEELQRTREMMTHTAMPVLQSLMMDPQGRLWVEEFGHPDSQAHRVAVYSTEGRLEGAFELPTQFSMLSAEGDHVVVISRPPKSAALVSVLRLEALPRGVNHAANDASRGAATSAIALTSRKVR